jgi:phosphatidylserine/phosphatidylglycerophosphate/cardiolipin synthase-like enzyme
MPSSKVLVRTYLSPTLVLLAYDWADARLHPDFLGFAIRRSPGFSKNQKSGYLLNKLGFPGTPADGLRFSDKAPIQKFVWWDSAICPDDQGKTFKYTVIPVLGTGALDLKLLASAAGSVSAKVPGSVRGRIGTYFNRAVVSSQAFTRQFGRKKLEVGKAMAWLSNGMQTAIVDLLGTNSEVTGSIYHLTDEEWVLPAMKNSPADLRLVYAWKPPREESNRESIDLLGDLPGKNGHFKPRTKTAIMHDKFLVKGKAGKFSQVLMGSANFTPEGLTSQANLLHTFASPELASLYADRAALLASDPTVPATAKGSTWSKPVKIDDARVRVFFSPEPKGQRESLETVVDAITNAKSSVIFCLFSPTDRPLLDALLAAGDKKKMLFGLLNSISDPSKKKTKDSETASGEPPKQPSAATIIKTIVFHRSRRERDVLAYSYFERGKAPANFLPELRGVDFSSRSSHPPPNKAVPAVHIHHKFIVIDAETKSPTIFTGSANFSENSTHRNDENLLEIKGDPALAQTYLAEFIRLYDHYRARALYQQYHERKPVQAKVNTENDPLTLKLTRDGWIKDAFKPGTVRAQMRERLARPLK